MLLPFNLSLMNREVFSHTTYGNNREGKVDILSCEDCMQVSSPGLLPRCWQCCDPGIEIMRYIFTRETMP
jgi:hypothetical protein